MCALFWGDAKPNFDRPSQNLAHLEWPLTISPHVRFLWQKSYWLSHIDNIIWIIIYNAICYYGIHFIFINFYGYYYWLHFCRLLKLLIFFFDLVQRFLFTMTLRPLSIIIDWYNMTNMGHIIWLTYECLLKNYLDLQNVEDLAHVLWDDIVN